MFAVVKSLGEIPFIPEANGALPALYAFFDADNDGDEDFVYTKCDYPTGQVLTGLIIVENINGNFVYRAGKSSEEAVLSFPGRVLKADFNSDGLLDIYVGTFGNELIAPTQLIARDEIYINRGNLEFERQLDLPFPNTWAHGSVVGDLNGDNVPDIFSTGKVGQPSYHFLQEGGSWRVEEVPLTFRHTGQSPFESRQGIDMSELADVDGDGLQDLILGTWTQNHQDGIDPTLLSKFPSEIYFGTSSGISATPITLPDAPGWNAFDTATFSIEVGDLSGDGLPDIVLGHSNDGSQIIDNIFYPEFLLDQLEIPREATASKGFLQVLINNGDRTFTDISGAVTGSGNNQRAPFLDLDLVDFNGDGHLDIFGSSGVDETLIDAGNFLWLNNGNASGFTAVDVMGDLTRSGDNILEIHPAYCVRVSDYDSDGDPDILWQGFADLYAIENISPIPMTTGTNGADNITIGSYVATLDLADGDDIVTGNFGNDIFTGGGGSDSITGGLGSDTGVFRGVKSDYSVSEIGSTIVITDSQTARDGSDTLSSIENFQFSDGNFQLSELLNVTDIDRGIYRFFNVDTGTHFLSGSTVERDSVINTLDTFNFEGPKFKAADPTNPAADTVFRFFNTQTGTHFFTQSTAERDNILDTIPQFNFEGEAYKGYTEQVDGSIPLYRFFNTQTGTHFYTAAEAEKDSIVANLPTFNFEGTTYWVDPVLG